MGFARHDIRCLAASAVGVPSSSAMSGAEALFVTRGRDILKSAEEIMEILDAYDLTGSLRDSAELVGCSHHTVKRYVEARGSSPTRWCTSDSSFHAVSWAGSSWSVSPWTRVRRAFFNSSRPR